MDKPLGFLCPHCGSFLHQKRHWFRWYLVCAKCQRRWRSDKHVVTPYSPGLTENNMIDNAK